MFSKVNEAVVDRTRICFDGNSWRGQKRRRSFRQASSAWKRVLLTRATKADCDLVEYLERALGDYELKSRVRVERDLVFGRSLRAKKDLCAGDVLVSLPRSQRVVVDVVGEGDGDDELNEWSKKLSRSIVKDKHERRDNVRVWLESLPEKAPKLASIFWTEAMINDSVRDVEMRERLLKARRTHETFCEEEAFDGDKEELSRIRSFLHTRFFTDGKHRWNAPLIDFCNHAREANCFVRINRGKFNSQGKLASAEISAVVNSDDVDEEEEYFELVVSDECDYIEAGEHLTICYASGVDSNRILFEQFGFLADAEESLSFITNRELVDSYLK